MDWSVYFYGLLLIFILASSTWLLSLYLRDVSIVDSAWPLMFLFAALYYFFSSDNESITGLALLAIVTVWSVRLFLHLTWRNWGEPEDRRYREIRKKYSPHFAVKSLFIIFLFQAVLAWIISIPLFAGFAKQTSALNDSLTILQVLGLAVWAVGMFYETVSDLQLGRFKRNLNNQGQVLNTGLWKHTRHPNYFGEFLIWWGFFLFVLSADTWWSIISPVIMSWLLLRFSGVTLLEKDIGERRPQYRAYIQQTNAFFPGPTRKAEQVEKEQDYYEEHA